MHNYKIGAVVLNYNTSELTLRCCRKLGESLPKENIVLVDNCSNDSEQLGLDRLSENDFVLIRANGNRGYSAGNNLGINRLLSNNVDYILIVNPDVAIERKDIESLLEKVSQDDKALFAGPRIVDGAGRTDVFAQIFRPWNFKAVLFSKYPFSQIGLFGIRRGYFRCKRDFSVSEKCFTVSGCCVLFKSQYFRTFGLFDEDFFLYNEEVVWGHNAHSAGCHALYVGEATAVHDHPKKQRKTKPGTVIQRMRSNLIYLEKYLHCGSIQKKLLALYYTAAYNYLSFSNPEFKKRKSEFIAARRHGVQSESRKETV